MFTEARVTAACTRALACQACLWKHVQAYECAHDFFACTRACVPDSLSACARMLSLHIHVLVAGACAPSGLHEQQAQSMAQHTCACVGGSLIPPPSLSLSPGLRRGQADAPETSSTLRHMP